MCPGTRARRWLCDSLRRRCRWCKQRSAALDNPSRGGWRCRAASVLYGQVGKAQIALEHHGVSIGHSTRP